MKLRFLSIVLFVFGFTLCLQAGDKYYVKMADSEMKRNPESWMLDFSSAPKWNYCHGLMLQAILQTWEKTHDQRYFDYAYSYADLMISEDGQIKTYKLAEYNICLLYTSDAADE